MEDPEKRLSDAERDQAVTWLLSGRLTLEGFSEGSTRLIRPEFKRTSSGFAAAPVPQELPVGRPQRRATRLTGAVFGKVVKPGRIRRARWRVAGGEFCDVDLDLRQAEIHGKRTC
jgi:hypothetical protein